MPHSISHQAEALTKSAGVRVRDELSVVAVHGDDRRTWLNGQLTCDLRELEQGQGIYGLAVNVRGKIMADLWALCRGDELALLVPNTAQSTLLASFEHQIIMDDVTLEPLAGLAVISVQGPRAAEAVAAAGLAAVEHHRCDELGDGGLMLLVARPQRDALLAQIGAACETVGGCAVSDEAFELARLRNARPRFGVDFGLENYPQEVGLEKRAVAFDKGCYLGQEVICTLENRGRLNRHLARMSATEAPAIGAELTTREGKIVGQVTSARIDPAGSAHALGYVKRGELGAGTTLLANGIALQVLGPVE